MGKVNLFEVAKWFGVYLTLVVFFYLFSQYVLAPKPEPPAKPRLLIQVDPEKDHLRGDPEATNSLVEYCDYLKEACRIYQPVLKQLLDEFSGELKLVYRHFPDQTQELSKKASLAAEAAGKQDKFWEMHDKLFENFQEWQAAEDPEEVFRSYAEELELDVEKFDQDQQEAELSKKVETDLFGAIASGAENPPIFFLNGELLDLPPDFDKAALMIKEVLPSTNSQNQ